MADADILLEKKGEVARIVMNQPDRRNPLTVAFIARMLQLLDEVEAWGDNDSTRPYSYDRGRFYWLAAGVFLTAIGLGFAGTLLWAHFN